MRSVVHGSTVNTWCIVLGKVPAGGRKVVTLFSDKWMVYDRYGQFHFKTVTQLSEPRYKPVASAEVQGPVPNTVYKNRGDPKAILQDADELVLTPDAVDYYKELYDKRKGIADESSCRGRRRRVRTG